MARRSPAALVLAALVAAALFGTALALPPRRNFPLSIAVSPKGDAALVGNEERAGEVVSLPDLKLAHVLEAEKGSYTRWHASEPRVALFSSHLWIYDTTDWRLVYHTALPLIDLTFHEQSKVIGLQQISDEQYALMVMDLSENPTPVTFPIPDHKPNRIVYVGHDQVMILGSDGLASLWDIGTRTALGAANFEGMRGSLGADASLSRGLAAWISQETGKVGIVHVPDLQVVRSFVAHKPGYAEFVRFSPGGSTLVTGAGFPDSSLKLWNTDSGELLGRLGGIQPLDAAFTPDGQSLYMCDRRLEQPSLVRREQLQKPEP